VRADVRTSAGNRRMILRLTARQPLFVTHSILPGAGQITSEQNEKSPLLSTGGEFQVFIDCGPCAHAVIRAGTLRARRRWVKGRDIRRAECWKHWISGEAAGVQCRTRRARNRCAYAVEPSNSAQAGACTASSQSLQKRL
jgi:hypothetical protein